MFPLKVGIFHCHFFDYQMVTPPPRHSKSTCRSPNILALTLIWNTKDIWYCTLCEENGGQPSICFGRYPIFNQPHVYMTHWPPIVKRRILDLRSEEGWSVPYRANRGREIEGWSRTCLRFCICCAQPRLANVTQSRLSKVLAKMHKLFVQNTSHVYIIISNHTIWTHEFCHFNGNKH
jgi:hypothetical protein